MDIGQTWLAKTTLHLYPHSCLCFFDFCARCFDLLVIQDWIGVLIPIICIIALCLSMPMPAIHNWFGVLMDVQHVLERGCRDDSP